MDDLIKALQVFRKYGNPDYPTNCTHDQLFVNINPELVSQEDKEALDKLGFIYDDPDCEHGFVSYKFGSC